MKKNIKIVLLSLLALFIIAGISLFIVLFINKQNESPYKTEINKKHRQTITNIITKKYPTYDIKHLRLEYVNWSSTVDDADDLNEATKATVIIKNSKEQRTIHLNKKINKWIISSDKADYGSDVPDDTYFIEIESQSIGNAVDMDEYIKGLWVIPNKEGSNYKKIGDNDDWYYSVRYYKDIYKTQNGRIYVFDKENNNWKISEETYAHLNYYSNFTKVSKKKAIGILEKYSSYQES